MAVLKGINVDEFDNVTILTLEKISMRSKKLNFLDNTRVHIAISEADKSKSEEALVINEQTSFCKSDKVDNIDMIIDIPNEKALDQFISFLQELKEEHYNNK